MNKANLHDFNGNKGLYDTFVVWNGPLMIKNVLKKTVKYILITLIN